MLAAAARRIECRRRESAGPIADRVCVVEPVVFRSKFGVNHMISVRCACALLLMYVYAYIVNILCACACVYALAYACSRVSKAHARTQS